jgi:hypothetical protein
LSLNRRAILVAMALVGTAAAWAGQLQGVVTDPAGHGLLARVLAVNLQTRDSSLVYTDASGHFACEVPEGPLTVRASHGPEWSLAEVQAQAGDALTLALQRLVDMPGHGYYGVDLHMHSTYSDGRQKPAEVALMCQAEGLHIAALTDHESVAQQPEWLALQGPSFLPLRGQEVTTTLGHILSLGCAECVSNDVAQGAADMTRVFREIHAQGGMAIVAHPNVPGMSYRTLDVRDYDALEILNGSVPPYGGVCDFVQGRKAWHSALSQGHRIPVVGNSDNHDGLAALARQLLRNPDQVAQIDKDLAPLVKLVDVERVLLPWGWKGLHHGTYRTYLRLEDQPTPEAVMAAVKAGRSFVTNGPLLLATLDAAYPGSEVVLGERPALEFYAELFANRPLERLDLLVNGQVAVTLPSPGPQVSASLTAKPGDWVVAELYGPCPEFATTNAWYVR